mmetsp:Transcript_3975/g.25022  ORF Transcript_3975/g.25022 Transcript_3975/m.25022 type:complete len:169 (+) Transcript_3975:662-1168(+)
MSTGMNEGEAPRRNATGKPARITVPGGLPPLKREHGGREGKIDMEGTGEAEAPLTTSEKTGVTVGMTVLASLGISAALVEFPISAMKKRKKGGQDHPTIIQMFLRDTTRSRSYKTGPLLNAPTGMDCKFQRDTCDRTAVQMARACLAGPSAMFQPHLVVLCPTGVGRI